MVSDEVFFANFHKWILELPSIEENKDEDHQTGEDKEDENEEAEDIKYSRQVSFFVHQTKIIPKDARDFYCNLMRAYPTCPLYLLLSIGTMGTNIARFTAIRRLSGHLTNVIRTGCFYKFLAPSRYGKGIAMGFVTTLGNHIESLRAKSHAQFMDAALRGIDGGNAAAQQQVKQQCNTLRPSCVFLTGGNVLQTHATAACNAGCGLIVVDEIKSGRSRYTDPDGSYGTFLNFYDPDMKAKSYRNAKFIPKIDKCRMQMIAAGVKED